MKRTALHGLCLLLALPVAGCGSKSSGTECTGTEVCDYVDNDCDGQIDEEVQWGNLGQFCTVGTGGCQAVGGYICDPNDPSGPTVCSATPGDPGDEVCDGLDNDCDGVTDEDFAELGTACTAGTDECLRHGWMVCSTDGSGTECSATPGVAASELCDGLDNNCDGQTDEDFANLGTGCTAGTGECLRHGWTVCTTDGTGTECSATPGQGSTELCDGLDNNCDGQTDEGALWADKGTACVVGTGVCEAAGIKICDSGDPSGPTVCSATAGSGGAEQCDGLDNDCDGTLDNNLTPPPCPLQTGVCAGSVRPCRGALGFGPCDASSYGPNYQAFESNCDMLDNDCNGVTDDVDQDLDGYISLACGGGDCDDQNIGINPGMEEVCGNTFDEDCSGAQDDRDVDRDGWVDSDLLCGGTDCDDRDPMVFPGAPEFRDGRRNDCLPTGMPDEGLIQAGDLIITEILYDSVGTPDQQHEWFEVFNPTDRPIDLRTWLVRDQPGASQESFVVGTDLVVGPRDFAVLCASAAPALNGGVACDYEYGFFSLANTANELIVEAGAVVVDEVWYDETSGWPVATTGSLNLDPDFFYADNNVPASWCNHPNGREIPNGDEATPGVSNVPCSGSIDDPRVVAVHPDHGISAGGTTTRIVGSGFTNVTDVQVGGATCSSWRVDSDNQITCTTAAGAPGAADVTVTEIAASDTLTNAFMYTREAQVGPELVNSAETNRPASTRTTRTLWTEGLYGHVTETGVTGAACPASGEYVSSVLIAQVGLGPAGSDPRTNGAWIWFPAFCVGQIGPADEFKGAVFGDVPGSYSFCYRFSVDGGVSWNYADLDGTGNGFNPAQLGVLIID